MSEVLAFIQDNPSDGVLAVLFLAAAAEYIVPPLPADTVVVAGGLLVSAGAYPFLVVYSVAVLGGVLGSLAHYVLGRKLSDGSGGLKNSKWVERIVGTASVPRFIAAFRKYGLWVVVVNRALPGIRGVTFLAAGAARLGFSRVMFAGLVSNLGWTLLLLSVGVRVGDDWEAIQETLYAYRRAGYVLLISAAVLFVAAKVWHSLRRA